MDDITTLVGEASSLWTVVMALSVLVIGFVIGKRLFRKL